MFSLIRFFLSTSVVAAAALAAAVVLYRTNEVRRLLEFAEGQNVIVAHSFANTLRSLHPTFIASDSGMDSNALANRGQAEALHETMSVLSMNLPVLKVKIYRPDGLTVFSTDPSEIGVYAAANPGLVLAANEGKPASKLTFREEVSPFSGILQSLDMVESYLPIRSDAGLVDGVFELYMDVTPFVQRIRESTLKLAFGAVGLVGLLYAVLLLVVQRADRTIKAQYADIIDKNDALRREIGARQLVETQLNKARDELERRVDERTQMLGDEVAERQRAEERALRHRNDLAQVGAVLTIGEMATSLAHEINQPLTVISGGAQFCTDQLRAGKVEPAVLLDSLQQVVEQAQRAHEIVRRVRGFIRKEHHEPTVIDLNKTIRDVIDFLQIDAREYGASIEFDLAATLPPIWADPIQIQQVVLNLAHNGIEAMAEEGQADRRLTVRTFALQDGEVEVIVSDEGPGIPDEILRRVFDPFFTTKPGGLGMGLAISRSIVEAYGGSIWATSKSASGSVFGFRLPAAIEREEAPHAE